MISAVWWDTTGTRLYGRVKVAGRMQQAEQLFPWPVRARDRQTYERAMVARLDRYIRGDRG